MDHIYFKCAHTLNHCTQNKLIKHTRMYAHTHEQLYEKSVPFSL